MVALEEKNFQITKAKSFVGMVVIVDPSLFCCVNHQASSHDPSFSHLKHLWRETVQRDERIFRVFR